MSMEDRTNFFSNMLTVQEVAYLLRRSERTIYRMVDRGVLKAYKISGDSRNYFRREEVEGIFEAAA